MKSRRWASLACLAIVAACGSDGGSSGTGITTVAGNVASVDAPPGTVSDIRVAVAGTAFDATDAGGRFEIRGDFEGVVTVTFARPLGSLLAEAVVNVPADGTLTLEDVRIDFADGLARPDTQRVDCEAAIVAVDCAAALAQLASREDVGDTDLYVLRLEGSFVHDPAGNPVPCDALAVGDAVRVHAVVEEDGSFGRADVELDP